MGRQKHFNTEYLSLMSALTSTEQTTLLALIALSDDEGRGIANPALLLAGNPQLAAWMSEWDAAEAMNGLLEKWEPYVEYEVGGAKFYVLADYKQFCTVNHPSPSKLPPPPVKLLPNLPSPTSVRGRPRGSAPTKPNKKPKKAAPQKSNWTDPEYPEATYQAFQAIFNEVLGPHVGCADYISRNTHRNIDLSIREGRAEQDFRRACEIAAKSDWYCKRAGTKQTPSNLETTCAPATINNLLSGRYGGI